MSKEESGEIRDGGGMSTAGMSCKEVQDSEEDNTGGGGRTIWDLRGILIPLD